MILVDKLTSQTKRTFLQANMYAAILINVVGFFKASSKRDKTER